MLYLTRKLNQSVMIGNGIKITIVGIKKGEVKIGIKCENMTVLREELYQKISQQNIEAMEINELTDIEA